MEVEISPWSNTGIIASTIKAYGITPIDAIEAGTEVTDGLRLHASLAMTIQSAVSDNRSIPEIVEHWRRGAETLIARQRWNRSGSLLVSLDEALYAPEALAAACHDHGIEPAINGLDSGVVVEPFYRVLAQYLMASDPQLAARANELSALSVPLVPMDERTNGSAAQAFEDYRSGQRADHELHEIRSSLDRAEKNIELLTQERDYLRHQEQHSAAEDTYLRTKVEDLEQRNATLLQELFKVQEYVESQHLQSQRRQETGETQSARPAHRVFQPINLSAKDRRRWKRYRRLLKQSPWFDAQWYLHRYPDVARSRRYGRDPVSHYLCYGGFEGRHPGPAFDTVAYFEDYPDVYDAQWNPLVHYLRFGHKENRVVREPAIA